MRSNYHAEFKIKKSLDRDNVWSIALLVIAIILCFHTNDIVDSVT